MKINNYDKRSLILLQYNINTISYPESDKFIKI